MAEKRKIKKRKEDQVIPTISETEKPSKEEYAIAKWLKDNIPHKNTKFANYSVHYFTGVKAVDALLESKWGKPSKEDKEPFFKTRVDVVNFLDLMLNHKFFHRAKKVVVSEQELQAKLKKNSKKKEDEKKEDDEKEKDKKKKRDADEAESSHAEGAKDDKEEKGASKELQREKERKKRKIRLEMHMDQSFVDGLDAYVWIYDPIPLYYWICGTFVVLGTIGICVFPLWPPSVRKGVWYLSVCAVGFLFMILGLVLFRLLVFCVIWLCFWGKHHVWLFPNLLEDVGFFASFWPIYQYEYMGDGSSRNTKKGKKKKYKDSDNEDEKGDQYNGHENEETERTDADTGAETDRRNSDTGTRNGENTSESESESSQKSQTGRDFEIIEKEDAEESA